MISVYMVHFPKASVRGCVRIDGNGDASIYIDDRLSREGRRETLLHELRHLKRGDFQSPRRIDQVEGEE